MPAINKAAKWTGMLLGAALMSTTAMAESWKLELDEGGVKLYTSDSDRSPMKSYKVSTTVRGSLSSLVALLNDHTSQPKWMDKVLSVEKLQQMKDGENLFYTVYDAPWPAKDQDNVLYSKWHQDPVTYEMVQTVMAEPEYLNESKGRQRQAFYKAEWRLLPTGNGNVHVTYQAEIDPGMKRVPEWMKNMFVYEMPVKTIQNMNAMSLDRYTEVTYAYVKEPVDTAVAANAISVASEE